MTDQGVEYAAFIKIELDREYARRDSVNARAATAISSVTGLATLVIAAAAVVRGQGHALHGCAVAWLVVAVMALLGAGVLSLLAGLSWKFEVSDRATMDAMVDTQWGDGEVAARNSVAKANVATIATLRVGNNRKVRLLIFTYGFQTGAVAALVGALLAVVG